MAEMRLFRLDCSYPIIVETLRILRDKFEWSEDAQIEAEAQMRRIASYVSPSITLNVVKEDPDDNRIIECAVEAESDLLSRETSTFSVWECFAN